MIGDRVELTHDDPESYALRVDGTVVARLDRMLIEALQHWARTNRATPWLEVVAIPETRAAPK